MSPEPGGPMACGAPEGGAAHGARRGADSEGEGLAGTEGGDAGHCSRRASLDRPPRRSPAPPVGRPPRSREAETAGTGYSGDLPGKSDPQDPCSAIRVGAGQRLGMSESVKSESAGRGGAGPCGIAPQAAQSGLAAERARGRARRAPLAASESTSAQRAPAPSTTERCVGPRRPPHPSPGRPQYPSPGRPPAEGPPRRCGSEHLRRGGDRDDTWAWMAGLWTEAGASTETRNRETRNRETRNPSGRAAGVSTKNRPKTGGGPMDGRRRGPSGRVARAGPTRSEGLSMEPAHETDSVVPCPAARVHSPCRGSIGEESNRREVNRLRSPPMVTSRPRREACKAPPGPCGPQGPRRSRAGRAGHLDHDAGGRPVSQWRLPFSRIPCRERQTARHHLTAGALAAACVAAAPASCRQCSTPVSCGEREREE